MTVLGVIEALDSHTITAREHTTARRQNRMPVVSMLDPDAVAFLAAAAITDPIITDAVSNLASALKTAGIWTKLKALWPFVGGSAFTHQWNLKDPRDLDAAYRLSFFGSWIHSLTTGITPDGSTAYADTHLSPTAVLTADSGSLGIYCRTAAAGGGQPYDFACDDGDTNPILVIAKYSSGSSFACYGNSAFTPNTAVADALGFWVTNRLSAVTTVGWHNGSVLDTADHAVVMPSSLLHLYLGCDNRAGTPTYFSSKNYALAFVADGLTSAENANFYTAVQAFQTTLSRNV